MILTRSSHVDTLHAPVLPSPKSESGFVTLDFTSKPDAFGEGGLVSQEDKNSFNREGYLTVERAASSEEVDLIRSILLDLKERRVGEAEGASFDALAAEEGGPETFRQISNPRSYAPALLKTGFYAAAMALAKTLLGADATLVTDIFFMKPARCGGATPWHQDEAFRDPGFDYRDLTIWLALQPVDETNSCMHFIPGSHLGTVLEHRSPGGDDRVHMLECAGPFDRAGAVPCRLPAGGCSVHDGRTLHHAGPNESAAPRLAWALVFSLPPTPRAEGRVFPWREVKDTPRMRRERAWRRRGGILIHLWRKRRGITMGKMLFLLTHLPGLFKTPF